jgi:hypothetical protein
MASPGGELAPPSVIDDEWDDALDATSAFVDPGQEDLLLGMMYPGR